MDPTEAELESFRRKWREEVSARARGSGSSSPSAGKAYESHHDNRPKRAPPAGPSAPLARASKIGESDEIEPRTYHDLPNKEESLRLDSDRTHIEESNREPRSALEHYEKAVERETQGSLGDSVSLYRKAFKLDSSVHEKYKNKHFPPSSYAPKKPTNPNPPNTPTTVPSTVHHSLHGLPLPLTELINDFAQLSIPRAEPPTDASPPPPCPIANIPGEVLTEIFFQIALHDLASFGRLAQVCRRFAYLVVTEERIWRRIATGSEIGFGAMHYRYNCDLHGRPLSYFLNKDDDSWRLKSLLDADESDMRPSPLLQPSPQYTSTLLQNKYAGSWRQMFRSRPRIRFNGCYISTVNYSRPGAASTTQLTWNSPVLIVTYYRYLRFYRDGTVISLQTPAEPQDVVHHLIEENVGTNSQAFPGLSAMKGALHGRWRITGPVDQLTAQSSPETSDDEEDLAETVAPDEQEGDLYVETESVVSKYMMKMQFGIGNAGRGTRNNKLQWKGFWSYNRYSGDWGELVSKHDRAFTWSRVKSWT
ncbi:hypothetical protein EV356DRAFT_511611 [Viridothelium virens]|uniref:F-box domain-containing protein n=1 Tax=Viridothelium virens TaxID=1048519 RepID=A0A6A6HHS0_VIRVR|nr:hypothetical protein EV356DRAFT_511611 [Viridothelium virens]